MADFVAVIRKAVDGLANNTPEMRAKVYEKARGAVQRQLENMKPRPPEELLQRQLNKIDAAISEVESEYAEAVEESGDEADSDAFAPAYAAVPYADEPEEEAARPEAEETSHEDEDNRSGYAAVPDAEHEPEAYEPPSYEQRPVYEAPQYEAPQAYQPFAEPVAHSDDNRVQDDWNPPEPSVEGEGRGWHDGYEKAADEQPEEPRVAFPEQDDYSTGVPDSLYDQPELPRYVDDGRAPSVEDEWSRGANETVEPLSADPVLYPRHDDSYHHAEVSHDDAPATREEYDSWSSAEVRHDYHDESPAPAETQRYTEDFADAGEPVDDRQTAYRGHDPLAGLDDYPVPDAGRRPLEPEVSFGEPAHTDDRAYDEYASGEVTPEPETVRAGHFEEVQWEGLAEPVTTPGAAAGDTKAPAAEPERSPWEDLEELIGYNGGKEKAAAAAGAGIAADLATPAMEKERPVSYAAARKKKRNYATPILAILGLALVAGGGYAMWLNRDAINDVFGGLTQAARPEGQDVATPPAGEQPVTGEASQPAGTTGQETAVTPPPATSVPGDDGAAKGAKFTQRLMPDGSEVDEGEAGASVAAEGQSVANQNEAPPAGTTAPPAAQGGATAPAGQTQAPPPAGNAPLPAGAQRVFLYEERLGQTVPTTLEGSVSWSLQEETDANGAPEKVVQGRLDVPGRGLSALVTIKRNSDPSLPASHLIEMVFSVGAGFDGGAIESVQRVAMKQTEQDRGNALIAVPARITDDFHMIALNDFPDARATNLELLRSRNWIDIPLTYRNGRRALLTMPKGPEGVKAFDEALSSWAAQPATSQ